MSELIELRPDAPKFYDKNTVKQIIAAAQRDPDVASCFYYGDGTKQGTEGAIIVIKGMEEAEYVQDWLLKQGLTTENPIPKKGK
jgi:hypothetical protein